MSRLAKAFVEVLGRPSVCVCVCVPPYAVVSTQLLREVPVTKTFHGTVLPALNQKLRHPCWFRGKTIGSQNCAGARFLYVIKEQSVPSWGFPTLNMGHRPFGFLLVCKEGGWSMVKRPFACNRHQSLFAGGGGGITRCSRFYEPVGSLFSPFKGALFTTP